MEDYISCPICGQHVRSLSHHCRKHNMTSDEFRNNYPNTKMACDSTTRLRREVQYGNFGKLSKDVQDRRRKQQADEMRKSNVKMRKRPEFLEWEKFHGKEIQKIRIDKYHNDPEYREIYKFQQKAGALKRKGIPNPKVKELWKNSDYVTKMMNRHPRYRFDSSSGFRSSYEVELARTLDDHNVMYEYENKVYHYTLDGKLHNYLPDFYLPDYNLYLEVKPIRLLNQSINFAKRKAMIHYGFNFSFICEYEIYNDNNILWEYLNSLKVHRLSKPNDNK